MVTTKEHTSAARQALAAANADMASTEAALDAARARIPSAEQEMTDAEAAVTAALIPGNCTSKTELHDARARFEKARDDLEWAHIEIRSAEAALTQTAEAAARAQRAVTGEEYLIEHQRFNDPEAHENKLLDQLTRTVAELLPLLDDRAQRHQRLAQEYDAFPADEKRQLAIPSGRRMMASSFSVNPWRVDVHNEAIAEAIKAGVEATRR